MTKIEWVNRPGTKGETWNPVVGCSITSPGCTNCYAMRTAHRIVSLSHGNTHYVGTTKLVKGKPVFTGEIRQAPEHTFTEPLRATKPRTYFVNSMGDPFHENVPEALIDRVFAVMALCPQHTFIVLTKRSKRMLAYMVRGDDENGDFFERISEAAVAVSNSPCAAHIDTIDWPLPNVWVGVSTERQQEADERIPDLLATPAAVRFISAEPLLGPIDLRNIQVPRTKVSALDLPGLGNRLDWVIVGGESGPGARPMHPDWVRSLRDQCAAARVPYFFKQWGEWRPEDADFAPVGDVNLPWGIGHPAVQKVGKARAGRLLDGREHTEWPQTKVTEPA